MLYQIYSRRVEVYTARTTKVKPLKLRISIEEYFKVVIVNQISFLRSITDVLQIKWNLECNIQIELDFTSV